MAGKEGGPRTHPAPCLQPDIIHSQANKLDSTPRTGRTSSTTNYRDEAASGRLKRSERLTEPERGRKLYEWRRQRNQALALGSSQGER